MVSTNASEVIGPTPGWVITGAPFRSPGQPFRRPHPVARSVHPAWPALSADLPVYGLPRAATATPAGASVRPHSTACASAVRLGSAPGVAVRSSPVRAASPACSDESATAAD